MGKGRARQQPQNHQTTHYLSSRSGITNPPVPNPHLPHHIPIYPSSIVKLINEFTHSGTSGLKSSHVLRPNPSHPPFTPSTNSTTFTNPTPHAPDHNKPIHSFTNPYGDIYPHFQASSYYSKAPTPPIPIPSPIPTPIRSQFIFNPAQIWLPRPMGV